MKCLTMGSILVIVDIDLGSVHYLRWVKRFAKVQENLEWKSLNLYVLKILRFILCAYWSWTSESSSIPGPSCYPGLDLCWGMKLSPKLPFQNMHPFSLTNMCLQIKGIRRRGIKNTSWYSSHVESYSFITPRCTSSVLNCGRRVCNNILLKFFS